MRSWSSVLAELNMRRRFGRGMFVMRRLRANNVHKSGEAEKGLRKKWGLWKRNAYVSPVTFIIFRQPSLSYIPLRASHSRLLERAQ